ncbi:MAG: GNAT family N-acetyltransferase [Paracoccaceae bacterium]|nr:GNAT family N-acetyltransferase [Paracoccaceae bacterium]MDG1370443.1 GNAT family N-acetyltransferase [Paracoccaceae bacterium]MDG1971801.1 GNAT family N-acetyltransferase [Paracoccaceae bacterium]
MASSPEAVSEFKFLRFEDMDGAALYALLKLRFDVFILEQESIYPELDDQDQAALHCVAYAGDTPIATLRMLDKTDIAIGRVAVRADHRGTGLAQRMMQAALARISVEWPDRRVVLSAQQHLENFYSGFGFKTCSGVYDDGGIPHVDMIQACNGLGSQRLTND